MSFWKELGKIGKAVLPIAGSVAGTLVGGPAGTSIGGALGGALGGLIPGGGGASAPQPAAVPQIAPQQVSAGYTGFSSLPSPRYFGETVMRDGTVRTPRGVLRNRELNGELYGSETHTSRGNSNNNSTMLMLGVGALLLLSK